MDRNEPWLVRIRHLVDNDEQVAAMLVTTACSALHLNMVRRQVRHGRSLKSAGPLDAYARERCVRGRCCGVLANDRVHTWPARLLVELRRLACGIVFANGADKSVFAARRHVP